MSEIKINSVVGSCNKAEGGWVSFIELGAALLKNGFNYKATHGRLLDFIKSEKELEWKREEVNQESVFFARLREKTVNIVKSRDFARATSPQNRLNQARYALNNFGIMDMKKALPQLAALALSERWYYNTQYAEYPYPILENYLRYTFFRLQQESKIVSNTDSLALIRA